ncbi:MAG: hypothetical protein MUE93_05210 [Ignavibacteriaceae bacterium]|nr:hypothetical protein [Ignavibacteriaceae bacterium]
MSTILIISSVEPLDKSIHGLRFGLKIASDAFQHLVECIQRSGFQMTDISLFEYDFFVIFTLTTKTH